MPANGAYAGYATNLQHTETYTAVNNKISIFVVKWTCKKPSLSPVAHCTDVAGGNHAPVGNDCELEGAHGEHEREPDGEQHEVAVVVVDVVVAERVQQQPHAVRQRAHWRNARLQRNESATHVDVYCRK